MISFGLRSLLSGAMIGIVAAAPSSVNFNLKSYDLGSGVGGSTSSSNYNLNVSGGTQSNTSTSSNYGLSSGLAPSQNAYVPPAPNLTNPGSNEYNRLNLVLDNANNPGDTKFAIAISSNNFVTTNFVKSDNSIGTTLALSDYQEYSVWGGSSGFFITGLSPNTTYKVKVKAMQGNFTESAYGPETPGVATVLPSLSFGLSISPPSGPPYVTNFSSLSPGTVYNSNADAVLSFTTNSAFGGMVYIKDSNSGLNSASAAYNIDSITGDLGTLSKGYGAIITSSTQSSGGPISNNAPFNGSADNVGALSSTLQELATTSSPIVSAVINVRLKAKTDTLVPSANDYSDIVSFVASMNY